MVPPLFIQLSNPTLFRVNSSPSSSSSSPSTSTSSSSSSLLTYPIYAKASSKPPVSPTPLPSTNLTKNKQASRKTRKANKSTSSKKQETKTYNKQSDEQNLVPSHLDVDQNFHQQLNFSLQPLKRRRTKSFSKSSSLKSPYHSLSPEDVVLLATISKAKLSSTSIFSISSSSTSSSAAAARKKTSKKNNIISTNSAATPIHNNELVSSLYNVPTEQHAINARNQITVKWLWLVSAIARKLYYSYTQSFPEMQSALSLSDLIQEGVCGLIQAVEKWDVSKGYPFDSFAFYTIKHCVIRAVQNQSRPIRLPIHVLDKLSKMRKLSETLKLNNRPINVDIIAKHLGLSKSSVELYLQRNHSTVSIDAPIQSNNSSSCSKSNANSNPNNNNNINSNSSRNSSRSNANNNGKNSPSLREFLIDHTVDVARHVEQSCTREAVNQLVNSADLLDLERNVLFLKFGLNDGVERVRAEVSRILDVRVHNVRRAELSALKKLRDSIGDDTSWAELLSEN